MNIRIYSNIRSPLLERIQKAALRVIMGKQYINYKNSLKELNLETLEKRRETLCLKFAKNCLKNEKLKDMFPLKKIKHEMKQGRLRSNKLGPGTLF